MSNPIIDSEGTKRWGNSNKELHRLDGPAIEALDGYKAWYINGKRHRLDGPAIEALDGYKAWWVDGVKVDEEDYPAAVLLYKCRMVLES
jgi:hypothetical protein